MVERATVSSKTQPGINWPFSQQLQRTARLADAICFGTLSQRSDKSRETIRCTLSETRPDCLKIFDVNLRSPYWSAELVLDCLNKANVLKLNDEELSILGGMLGLSGSDADRLAALQKRYSLQTIALTRGANGSILLGSRGEWSERPGEVIGVVDTVGAGDAFAAALTIGLLRGEPLDTIHGKASDAATFVCTQSGATPSFPKCLHED
jgi:fructokinase